MAPLYRWDVRPADRRYGVAQSSSEERTRRGRYLRAARERAGMFQGDVADTLGYSVAASISHWERGRRDPSLADLKQLAAVYGVPLSLFIDPPPSELDAIDDAIRAAEEAERSGDQSREARAWVASRDMPTPHIVQSPGPPDRT